MRRRAAILGTAALFASALAASAGCGRYGAPQRTPLPPPEAQEREAPAPDPRAESEDGEKEGEER